MKRFLALIFTIAASFLAAKSFAAANTSQVSAYSYAGGNVTTSAYTTIIASTAISTKALQICDTSTKVVKLATGAASSEIDICTVMVSGCVVVPYFVRPGTRLSIKAVDATATTGYNTVALIP